MTVGSKGVNTPMLLHVLWNRNFAIVLVLPFSDKGQHQILTLSGLGQLLLSFGKTAVLYAQWVRLRSVSLQFIARRAYKRS